MARTRPKSLAHEVTECGLVSEEALEQAREQSHQDGTPLDQALVASGAVDEAALLDFIAEHYQVPLVDLDDVPLDHSLIDLLPEKTARHYLALPLYKKGHTITVAMAEAWDVARVDEVRFSIGRSIRPVLASRTALREKLDDLFVNSTPDVADSGDDGDDAYDFLQDALSEVEGDLAAPPEQEADSAQKLLQESSASPIVKIVNDVLIRAVHKGASDIHIEPQESTVIVRFRLDGALREIMQLPVKAKNAIVSRVKVLSGMDISVSRKPQDGRIKLHYRDNPLDLRVSTLPTYWGEKVVMRLLDQSGVGLELDKLGFLAGEREQLEAIMQQPQGMLLVTGPTGSGKTTTLYSVLSAINQVDVNIITVEDPVEYQLARINQVPVNPKAGMTFASGLRAILRQDPNVIMVGEIRDQETAEIALESAETGHMVFSTLHTTSAAGAVTRFLDMNIPAYLLASSLSGVLAQRLLRRNCPDCSEPVEVGEGLRTKYNIPRDVVFHEGKGCPTCDGQGTKGRMGAYELLLADRDIQAGIHEGAAESALIDRARSNGMHLMFEDGLIKAMRGEVPLTEVLRSIELPPGVEIDAVRLWEEADLRWEERGTGKRPGAAATAETEAAGTALVVAEADTTSRLVAMVLEGEGMAVQTAASGREALDQMYQHPPQLVIAEVDIPDLDGIALAESMRREPHLQGIPLMLLAADDDCKRENRALEAGADEYLARPLDPERFLARSRRLRRIYRHLGSDGEGPPLSAVRAG